jgi:tRNA G46 methylase TrmB
MFGIRGGFQFLHNSFNSRGCRKRTALFLPIHLEHYSNRKHMNNQGYIHTFSIKEQDRLLKQGQFLEPYIHKNVDFTNCHHLLEIGCGVGAQISTLARNFPGFLIDGIDLMGSQINRANIVLKDLRLYEISRGYHKM